MLSVPEGGDMSDFQERDPSNDETKAIPENCAEEAQESRTEKAKEPGGVVSAGLNFGGGATVQVDIASCGTLDDTIALVFRVSGKTTQPVLFPKEWFAHELRIRTVEQFSDDVRLWLLRGNVQTVKKNDPPSNIIRAF